MHMTRNGFTMLELVVVITVVGILAAMVVPRFAGAQDESSVAATAADLHKIAQALSMYQGTNGLFPPNASRSSDATMIKPYFKGSNPFEKVTPIGGVYDYDGTPTHTPVTISILQDGSNRYSYDHALELDAYMDNGDLTSGRLREVGERLVYRFAGE